MVKSREETEKAIVEAWYMLNEDYTPRDLSEEEKAKFDQVRFAEEQSRRSEFSLGGKINVGL